MTKIDTESNKAAEVQPPDIWYGARHTQTFLLFILLSIAYCMRVNLSVAIVAMTDKTASINPDIPTYDWHDKSIVLSSFYWGYVILQVLAGYFATRFGAKWILTGAMMINSLASMAIPLMADQFGSYGVMACRVLQGLSQGFFYPSVHSLLGKWSPAAERSQLSTFAYGGSSFGTIIALPLTGYISASWLGWPVSFYVFGALGVIWVVSWIIFGFNSPEDHPYISKEERSYIESSLGNTKQNDKLVTPWKGIFTSLPMWAIIVANFGQNWGYATLLTEIPNYMNQVMGFDMKSNSLLSAAPYLAFWILTFILGPISDHLINSGTVSRGTSRKIFNTIGVCIPAAALAVLGYIPQDQTVVSVILLVIAVGVNAAVFCGFQVNHIDISPNYSGILMGITNGSSNIFSILAPLIVQVIVTDEHDKTLWRTVFLIAALMYILSAIFYNIFATGEVQEWNFNNCVENDTAKSSTNNGISIIMETNKENKI